MLLKTDSVHVAACNKNQTEVWFHVTGFIIA